MPQPSRPKQTKRQLDYDPSELEDLIHNPAVGTGVSSHLLTSPASKEVRDKTTEATSQVTTVVISKETNAASSDMSIVDRSLYLSDLRGQTNKTTDPNLTTTVNLPPLPRLTTEPNLPPVHRPAFWITDKGDPVPPKKVRQVRQAQDALSASEERVYDVLWTAAPAGDHLSSSRRVQAGYDFLTRKTRFSRKTIQRIIDKLIEKEFIEIAVPADIYSRAATVYRVLDYRTVLDRLAQRQRLHVAKIGPGVVFVRVARSDITTVDS
jgi:predicted transcriptional regulator